MSIGYTLCGLGAVLAFGFGLAFATNNPSGQEIMERYIDEIGGREVLDSIDSFHARGPYEIFGTQGTIELHYMKPDHLLFEVDIPGFGTIRKGYWDGVAWSVDPQQGPSILDESRQKDFLKWVYRGFSLLPGSSKVQAGDVEKTEFEGRPCYRVSMSIVGTSVTYVDFYDAGTGLFAGRLETVETPAGDLEMSGTASQYKTFDGYTIPTRWTHEAGGQTWSAVYEIFEINNVTRADFVLPEEIKSMQRAADEAP